MNRPSYRTYLAYFKIAQILFTMAASFYFLCCSEPNRVQQLFFENDPLFYEPERIEALNLNSATGRVFLVAPLIGPLSQPYFYICNADLTACRQRQFVLGGPLFGKEIRIRGVAVAESGEEFLALLEYRDTDSLRLLIYVCKSDSDCSKVTASVQLPYSDWTFVNSELFFHPDSKTALAGLPFRSMSAGLNDIQHGMLECNTETHRCTARIVPTLAKVLGVRHFQANKNRMLVLALQADRMGRPFVYSCVPGKWECRQRVLSQYEVNWHTKAGALADYGTQGGFVVVAAPEADSRPRLFLCETDDPSEPCRSTKVAFGGDDDWAPVMSNRRLQYDIAIDALENVAYVLAGTHVDSSRPVILKCNLGSLDCSGVILKKLPGLTGRFANLVIDHDNRRLIIATAFENLNRRLQLGVFTYNLLDFR